MRWSRLLLWMSVAIAATVVLAIAWIAVTGWNWLRPPIETQVRQKTGRALTIQGDLHLQLDWPVVHVQANTVTFANPQWATERYMLAADAVDIALDIPQLLHNTIVLPTVQLVRPTVFLEQGVQGRKNWLLDQSQQDEEAQVQIGQVSVDHGTLGYDDRASHTHIRAAITTQSTAHSGTSKASTTAAVGSSLVFRATGLYQQLPLQATGSGGSVMALRDERHPYPLSVDASIGQTHVKALGTVTSLTRYSAVDMQIALSGHSLEQLYPLLGIPAPASHAYSTRGHLSRNAAIWRYENFQGRMGGSDIAGAVEVHTESKRPQLTAQLTSDTLDLDDIEPMIGKRQAPETASAGGAAPTGVLPDLPFNAGHWSSMDADVHLHAKHIRRTNSLPMDALAAHITLRDAVLTLDPLEVDLAGGHVNATVALDGRVAPIAAQVHAQAHKVLLSKLFPTLTLSQASIGEINAAATLSGSGNSIGRMLATSNGRLQGQIAHGEVSQMMMEKAGLHLWEMLELNLAGDKRIALRCAAADFDVKHGMMQANTLVFDTAVTTLLGSGSIDLDKERLNLQINQRTKRTSPMALRSPIHIGGSFARPTVGVDKTRLAMRAAGSAALGLVNPFLALIPLIDPGPGADSDCAALQSSATASHNENTPAPPAKPRSHATGAG